MYTRRAELVAGLVVLAGVAAFLWLLYAATGRGFFERFSHWHVRFAQGDTAPEVGDPVVYLGLTIGRISRVSQQSEERSGARLTPADEARLANLPPGAPRVIREVYVLAELELPEGQRLPRGTTARLSKNMVTGTPTFQLLPGLSPEDLSPEETRTQPILGTQGATLDDITGKVDLLVQQVTFATKDVGEVVTKAKEFIELLHAKLDALKTEAINENVVAATASLRNTLATAEREVDQIAANVKAATVDLKSMASSGAAAVEQARTDLATLMGSLKSASAKVDEVVAAASEPILAFTRQLSAVAEEVTQLAKDFRGLGPQVREVVTSLGGDLDSIFAILEDSARNILDATEDIRAHPWKLTNKPDDDVVAFENLRLASLQYVRAMGGMESAARSLRDLLARPDAATVRSEVEAALAAFQKSREGYEAASKRFAELLKAWAPRGPR